jgi:class 3 adenylate cyclase
LKGSEMGVAGGIGRYTIDLYAGGPFDDYKSTSLDRRLSFIFTLNIIIMGRKSIGFQIFGIALGFTVLLAVTALFTLNGLERVTDSQSRLAHGYLPLLDNITAIEVAVLEQEILVERVRSRREPNARPTEGAEARMKRFKELGVLIDESIVLAGQQVAKLLEGTESTALGRIEALIDSVDREDADFEALAYELIDDEMEDPITFAKKLVSLQAEEDEFDSVIKQLRQEIADTTSAGALEGKEQQVHLMNFNLAITGIAGLVGMGLAGWITTRLVRRARELLAGVHEVGKGHLDYELTDGSQDELGHLASGFNEMVGQLRVKERIQDTFGKYVDPRVVSHLIEVPELTRPGGEKREMTVFFSDIAGFTTISEALTPQALVTMLNEYFTTMAEPIRETHGVIDKFIGDAIMAYWGQPFVGEDDHAVLACQAGCALGPLRKDFNARLPEILGLRTGAPQVDFRFGIATGPVVVGTIGSETTRNYTVIGDTVNLASRLEGAGKIYGVRSLIAETTRVAAGDKIEVREMDLIKVKGKQEAVRIYELLGMAGQLNDEQQKLRDIFALGLSAYRQQDWAEARSKFQGALEIVSNDGPSQIYLERLAHSQAEPPGDDWDGVWRMQTK